MLTRTALRALAISLLLSSSVRAQSAPAEIPAPRPAANTDPLPAYKLSLAIDLTALGTMAVVAATRLFASGISVCPMSVDPATGVSAPLCNKSSLNPLDRLVAGKYDLYWQTASNFGLYGSILAPAVVLLADEGFGRAVNDGAVVAESIVGAAAMSSILTLAAARPRPYMYSTIASPAERSGVDGTESFLSGHTAAVFAAGTALFVTERRLHPDSDGQYIVLAAGIAMGGFISVARVMGGNHFITDDLVGALVGTCMGVLFPALHDQPVQVSATVSDQSRGLSLQGYF